MTTAAEFSREVEDAAARVLGALSSSPKTAWELKMELKVPHTLLHLALGSLLARGKVSLRPEGYTLRVSEDRTDAAPA
ncbi:MAG: hypothetical protein AAB578_05030 [Elusimicrobiota bacterium]